MGGRLLDYVVVLGQVVRVEFELVLIGIVVARFSGVHGIICVLDVVKSYAEATAKLVRLVLEAAA